MIQLHVLPTCGWGLVNPSPFCVKAEVYLRMIGAPYELRFDLTPLRAPTKKLPWIEDGGKAIGDSELIIRHLQETRGDALGEAAIDPATRYLAHLTRRTLEESLYFALVSERWRDPVMREVYPEAMVSSAPGPARWAMRKFATHIVLKQLWQQGYGRHDLDTAIRKGQEDLDAVAHALGDRPFFGSETPHAIDASLFGFLANLWYVPLEGRLRRHMGTHPNLVAYAERMRARYAPEAAVPPVTGST